MPASQLDKTLVIVGPSGAGKSTLASWLKAKTGGRIIELGEIVRERAVSARFEGSPREFASRQFERHGDLWVVEAASIAKGERGLIVVGPRKVSELRYLIERVPATVVGVTASRATRNRRRAREEGAHFAELDSRDQQEAEWGVMECLYSAEIVVDTEENSPEHTAQMVLSAWLPGAVTKPAAGL